MRRRAPLIKYGDFWSLVFELLEELLSYSQAAKDPEWCKSLKNEVKSILKNDTWKIVNRPHGKKPIIEKWPFKVKRGPSREIIQFKARVVA
jgi:hypothetical protein